MIYERECGICHRHFVTGTKQQRYCSPECSCEAMRQGARRRDREKRLNKRLEREKKKALKNMVIEAEKHGMTYGTYVAMIERGGRIDISGV